MMSITHTHTQKALEPRKHPNVLLQTTDYTQFQHEGAPMCLKVWVALGSADIEDQNVSM